MSEPAFTIEQYVDLYQSAHPGAKRREIADFLGISEAYLCQIMGGVRHPSYKVMQKIALKTGGLVSVGSWSRRMAGAS